MKTHDVTHHWRKAAGFVLPVILVVAGSLFILAVGILLVSGLERRTARSLVERQRAELAAAAAWEEIKVTLDQEAGNDDFIIMQARPAAQLVGGRESAPQLCLVRGKAEGKGYVYRYIPMFSSNSLPADNDQVAAPALESFFGPQADAYIDFSTLPYLDKARAAWLPIQDGQGRTVARYAYWLEDLQGKLDPRLVGNITGSDQTHARASYPFPAPGLNPAPASATEPGLDQVALYVIDPGAGSNNQGEFGKLLINNRSLLLSPGSALAAAKISPPLVRDTASGRLADVLARAAEENLVASQRGYFERPLIPCAPWIEPGVAGSPRLNLNALLAQNPHTAVADMAGIIRAALPDFEQRKGGFPEDYLKTLAANAIDYADEDSNPTVLANAYRGLDAYPLLSEIALQVNYLGLSNINDRQIMTFRFKVFAELVNQTSQPVVGAARLSYEVALPMDGIGAGIGGEPFDSPALLDNPECATHDLTRIDGRYWSREISISLQPNQYQCYLFADVTYRMDVGSASDIIPASTPFSLNEQQGASGLSLMWNNQAVERVASIVRQQGLIYYTKNGVTTSGFKVVDTKAQIITKAALPGHVYEDSSRMCYNMGDPRITHYLRSAALAENAYPENASPNRRNIRLEIYKADASNKPKVYARVLPSEWPDGGHNVAVGSWSPGSDDKTEMTDARFAMPYESQMRLAAPQVIANAGRFFSVTELGRVFDPIMFAPAFASTAETDSFRKTGKMPGSCTVWPDVVQNTPSGLYGGGNTLRIGRPEHLVFNQPGKPGMHAARLLDLFHAGLSRSDQASEREGPVVRIEGHVNINTASRDVLRAMAAAALVMDPLLARRLSYNHLAAPNMAPATTPLVLTAPTTTLEADRIADAIIRGRPYQSASGLAIAQESGGIQVFGNKELYPESSNIEWTDAAAEEIFARVYEGSTVRSRNFRLWIVAQSLAPSNTSAAAPEVLAEVRRVHTIFADPGERAADGSIIDGKCQTKITSSYDF